MNKITTVNDHIMEHCIQSMEKALNNERHPLWERSCPELSDIDFINTGLLRAISVVDYRTVLNVPLSVITRTG